MDRDMEASMRMVVYSILVFAVMLPLSASAAVNVAGKTIKYMNAEGQTYWTTYHKDGTTSSKSTMIGSSAYLHDTGRWWIKNGRLCEQYTNWRAGLKFCR